jgi:hypothetical protein|tara:strand:- start:60 stop:257 length:198 start_codon:yes stop_codon:yes gene_type:complete
VSNNDYVTHCLVKVGLRRGNVFNHIDSNTINWLVDETIKIKADNLGLTIASILKDACYQEQGEER